MKKILLLILISWFDYSFGQDGGTLTEVENFGKNPGNLRMYTHYKTVNDTGKVPLVIVLHGCGQDARAVADLTGWNKLADLNNFVVVYPEQKMINNASKCFNWFHEKDIERDKGECESIYQMIRWAEKKYAIDTNQVFVTGLSAGAAMTAVMAATHPETFKQGAIFAGGAYKIGTTPVAMTKALFGNRYLPQGTLVKNVKEQNPNYKGEYPTMIIYQGLNDPIVNHKNAGMLVSQWTGLHNADTVPDQTIHAFMGVEDITRFEYKDSLGRAVVIYYEANNLGHKLLVHPSNKENEGGKLGVHGVDKGIHSIYQTAKEFGIIKNK